jgi:hypothetical protein
VADFLRESDYEFGFATYWNANIIAELADGAVEIANIYDPESLSFFEWSSPKRYYEEGYHDGKVFLIAAWEEKLQWNDCAAFQTGRVVFDSGAYSVFEFDSMEEFLSCASKEE